MSQELIQAAEDQNLSEFIKLLKEGKNVNDECQLDMFHLAAIDGQLEDVEYLLKKNPKLWDMTDGNDGTALHNAALNGRLEVVEYLIGKHPELCAMTDLDGGTALHNAAYGGHEKTILFLIAEMKPEQIAAKTNNGRDALSYAEKEGKLKENVNVIELLKNPSATSHKNGFNPDTGSEEKTMDDDVPSVLSKKDSESKESLKYRQNLALLSNPNDEKRKICAKEIQLEGELEVLAKAHLNAENPKEEENFFIEAMKEGFDEKAVVCKYIEYKAEKNQWKVSGAWSNVNGHPAPRTLANFYKIFSEYSIPSCSFFTPRKSVSNFKEEFIQKSQSDGTFGERSGSTREAYELVAKYLSGELEHIDNDPRIGSENKSPIKST